jgi:hypothetical protein
MPLWPQSIFVQTSSPHSKIRSYSPLFSILLIVNLFFRRESVLGSGKSDSAGACQRRPDSESHPSTYFATTCSIVFAVSIELGPTIMSNAPASTTLFMFRSRRESESGVSENATVCFSPGLKLTRLKPRNSSTAGSPKQPTDEHKRFIAGTFAGISHIDLFFDGYAFHQVGGAFFRVNFGLR